MDYRKFIAGALAFSLAAAAAGCGDNNGSTSAPESAPDTTAAAESTEAAEPETVEATEPTTEELIPPEPVEASDPNAVTFDDGDFSFVTVITDDDYAAVGELSVVEVMGNKMLKFTDDMSVALSGKVQKLSFNAAQLIGTENLPKVRRIEFDVYADAMSDTYVNEFGEHVKAPGYIGGGGGSVMADEKWYDFSEYAGGEYNFEMSGPVHGEFKFLLADGGKCWSEDMEDANFLIMRWGPDNESNLYIDNIVFYDADGNSIPVRTAGSSETPAEEAPAEEAPAETE